jgi:class 3 adenylate cyclase
MDYTVIGDNVNVAARIESVCTPGQVLISESTHRAVADFVTAERMDPIQVRNREQPVQLFAIRPGP